MAELVKSLELALHALPPASIKYHNEVACRFAAFPLSSGLDWTIVRPGLPNGTQLALPRSEDVEDGGSA